MPAPESARATRAIDAIEAAGHQINLVADVYDRNRRGVHVVFFHLRNTYAMNDDGSFDMVGLANLRYLSELWAGTHGFNFAGCVYFHENASAPEDLSLVLEQLGDYRPIDMDMFKEVCVEYGTDPDDVEFDE